MDLAIRLLVEDELLSNLSSIPFSRIKSNDTTIRNKIASLSDDKLTALIYHSITNGRKILNHLRG